MTSSMVPSPRRPGSGADERAGQDTAPHPRAPAGQDTAPHPRGSGDPGAAQRDSAPGRPRTDGVAVAALALGILALVPLAVGAGVLALARTKSGQRGGRTMAVAGIVLAGLWALAGAAVSAVLLAPAHPRHATVPRHPLRGTVFRLQTGQCANTAPNGIDSAHVVPCREPHDAEIYATFRLAGHRWPGTAAVSGTARTGCASRFAGYVNPQLAARLTESFAYPGRGAWNAGERTVICEVRAASGSKLTGSVRALGGT